MNCTVWRSDRKEMTYLYLGPDQSFEDLPDALKSVFGEPEFVLELELSPDRKLASEDVNQVISNLVEQGYHLQLPQEISVEEIIQRSAM
jgi:uncharacterized protein YcgL (UPF0745 family)